MYQYAVWQWFLFFYIYCFIGWIWETSYVSLKSGYFQNRGFMNGPFLPIYGSGAIVMLLAALPVRNNPVLVFFFGMIAATLLELGTGMAMEAIFHMRYWDYSYRKIQFKGHICLVSSLAWGFFSCLLIYVIHKPIENLVLTIPEVGAEILTMTLTIVCVSDFSTSFKAAIDLKRMIIVADEMRKQIAKLERRAEIMEVFMAESAGKASDELKERVSGLLGKLSATKEDAAAELANIKAESAAKLDSMSKFLTQNKSVSNLIKRNPGVVSSKYSEVLGNFKSQVAKSVKSRINRFQSKEV